MSHRERVAFLIETVELEVVHLLGTDSRLFAAPFSAELARTLRDDALLSERVDAFGARFARLQDTLGDKLLPALLQSVGESVGSALDNLARASRLGLLPVGAERWLAVRGLRNRIVHDYQRNPLALAQALNAAHDAVPVLVDFARACSAYLQARGLA
jgi:hypothetical protein